ncbi:MAG: adenosylmethionine decarboxylase [Patescibacteria group bacterium]
MQNSNPNGIHYFLEFFGCDVRQIDSVDFWKDILPRSVEGTDIKILHDHYYKFEPQGVTAFLLLSASHISVHSWPEHGYVACDVFACGEEKDTDAIVRSLSEHISHERVRINKVQRGFTVDK